MAVLSALIFEISSKSRGHSHYLIFNSSESLLVYWVFGPMSELADKAGEKRAQPTWLGGSSKRLRQTDKARKPSHKRKNSANPPSHSPESNSFEACGDEGMEVFLDWADDSAGATPKRSRVNSELPGYHSELLPGCAGSSVTSSQGSKTLAAARLLWETNYNGSMSKEIEGYEASGFLGSMRAILAHPNYAPKSTYLLQGRATASAKAAREAKDHAMLVRWCAEGTHRNNQHYIPFSMYAQSAAHVGHSAQARSWATTDAVTSRQTAIDVIHAMVRCRPRCPFKQTFRIFVILFDQVYRVKNCDAKKNRSTAKERINGTGAAQSQRCKGVLGSWESQTYVNCVQVPVPACLVNLTQLDVEEITRLGPFTGDWDMVYPMLVEATICC